MTTLIVTYAEGYTACFTRAPDGGLVQQALIHTNGSVPTAADLADLGEELTARFGWHPSTGTPGRPPISIAEKRDALPPVATRPVTRKGKVRTPSTPGPKPGTKPTPKAGPVIPVTHNYPAMAKADIPTAIVTYLTEVPDASRMEVLRACGMPTRPKSSLWQGYFQALLDAGVLAKRYDTARKGNVNRYRVIGSL